MAVKRGEKRRQRKHRLANAVRGKARRLTSPHAVAAPPPTSVSPPVAPPPVAERQPAPLPADLFEEAEPNHTPGLPPVMLVITILALIFISIITWFVAQMPAK